MQSLVVDGEAGGRGNMAKPGVWSGLRAAACLAGWLLWSWLTAVRKERHRAPVPGR